MFRLYVLPYHARCKTQVISTIEITPQNDVLSITEVAQLRSHGF